jgi:hypothetical protein
MAYTPQQIIESTRVPARPTCTPAATRPPSWRRCTGDRRGHAPAARCHGGALLAGHGLWRGGGLSEPFALTLAVLGRGEREFSATVKTSTGGYRLHVAASGRDAVLACHVPSSGQVVLRPARPEALAEDLFAELPAVGPSSWPGLSVPESDLRQAMNGAPPRRDVRRVMDVAALPRTGSGQISAGFRDGVHRYRKTGANVCTFYDTEQGRYLFSFTEEPGYERYVNVAPGRPETVIAKIYDLLEQLRRRP